MQGRRIVHIHQQHSEEHQLCGLDIEALWIHCMSSHALLHVEQFGIERAGHVDARLDTRRHEADQILVDCAALLSALLLVGIGTNSLANSINTYTWWNHRVLLGRPSRNKAFSGLEIRL